MITKMQNNMLRIANKINEGKSCEVTPELAVMRVMENVGLIARESFNYTTDSKDFDGEIMNRSVCSATLEILLLAELLDIDLSEELEKKINKLNEKLDLE